MTSTWEIGGKTVASLEINGKEVQSIIRNSDNAILYEIASDVPILSLSVSSNSISVFESSTVTATLTYNGDAMVGETVTFVDSDNNTSTETTDSNGQATYTFSSMNVGVGSVTASSNDITRVANITIVKGNTSLDIDVPLSLVYSDAFNVTGTLTGSDESVLASKTVKLKVGDTVVDTATTNSSGVVSFTRTPVTMGNHSFQLVYDGDSSTNACDSSIVTREIGKETTILSVPSPHGMITPYYSDDAIPIMGSLWDNDGTGLENKDIVLSDRGTYLKTITTGSNGSITGNLNELSVDAHTIKFEFVGDENYSASSVTKIVNIVNHSYSLTASVNNATIDLGDSVTVSGVLTKDSNAWSGQTVTLYDGATSLGTATTDSNGAYSKVITGLTVGNHSLKAVHSNVESSSVTVTVSEVQSYSLSLTGDSVIETGDSASVVATLSSSGSGVSGETLSYQVKYGSVVLDSGTGTTDSNGVVTIPYNAIGVGDVDVTVSYGNDVTETITIEDCVSYDTTEHTESFSSTRFKTIASSNLTNVSMSLDLETTTYNYSCVFGVGYNSESDQIGFGTTDLTGRIYRTLNGKNNHSNYTSFNENNVYYNLRFERTGTTLKVYLNDTLIDTSTNNEISSFQYLNLGSWLNKVIYYKNIKVKALSDDLILYSNKKILSQADNDSTVLTAYTTQGANQTVTMEVYDSTQTTLLDTLTVSDDGNGYYSSTYTANGYGDVVIVCECGLQTKTFILEDNILYRSQEYSCTKSTGTVKQEWADAITSVDPPQWFELSFEYKTTGAIGGEEHRLFFMPRTLYIQDNQPSTAMFVGNTECNNFQFGVRRDGTKLSESRGTLTCNEYHTIKIRRDGTKGSDVQNIISFYLDNTYLDYWGLPLAHNYNDWWFCFHLWRNGTVSIRNIKLKEL